MDCSLPGPWDFPGRSTGVGCHCLLQCMKVTSEREVTQLCPTLSDPMDCCLPGSTVHGIFQARVLEWGAIAFSNAWKWKVKGKLLSRVRLVVTPWTAANQVHGIFQAGVLEWGAIAFSNVWSLLIHKSLTCSRVPFSRLSSLANAFAKRWGCPRNLVEARSMYIGPPGTPRGWIRATKIWTIFY